MPIIQTPSGPAEFPDSMSMPDIEAVLQKQFGTPPISDETVSKLTKGMQLKIGTGWNADVKPSIGQSLSTSAPGELAYGAEMGLLGLGQSASHLANAATGFPSEQTLRGGDENMARARRQQELNRKLSATDKMPLWANPGEMIGQAAVQAPLVAALPLGAAGGLAKSMLQGGAAGAVTGAVQPVTDTSSPYEAQKLAQTVGGAAVGAAAPLGLAALGRFAKSTQSPEIQAIQKILGSLQRGKVSPENAVAAMTRYPDKELTLMDTGGQGTMRLGRTLDTLGAPKVRQFLENRDADQSARVLSDIKQNLADGTDVAGITDNLITARKANAKPLYQAAGIPDDPAQYANAPVLNTPAVARLLSKSKGIKSAIAQAKGLPDYADLPDNSIVLLDKAYKNIGGSSSAARQSGDKEAARDLDSLRVQLKNAITGGDADHPYAKALESFSSDSDSIDAINSGKDFLKLPPEQLVKNLKGMSAGDRDLYRVGAARELQDMVNKSDRGSAASRVNASPAMRKKITAVFGKGAPDFIESMGAEKVGAQTSRDVLGNSNTAGKLVDVGEASPDYTGAALHGALSHNPSRAVTGPLRLWAGRKLTHALNPMTPDVQSALGDILTRTGTTPNLTIPASIGGLSRLPSRGGVPIGSAAAMALSRLLAAQGGGQPYGQ